MFGSIMVNYPNLTIIEIYLIIFIHQAHGINIQFIGSVYN